MTALRGVPNLLNDNRYLASFLQMTVPLEMQRLVDVDPWALQSIANQAVTVIAEKGDVLQFGGSGAREAVAALARGLAAAALTCPGGVTFTGLHWCVDHNDCEAA